MDNSAVVDFDNFCRICCSSFEPLMKSYDIFNAEQSLVDQIHECLPIKVSKTDPLPKLVCEPCVNSLRTFHKFRTVSKESEEVLQGFFDCNNVNLSNGTEPSQNTRLTEAASTSMDVEPCWSPEHYEETADHAESEEEIAVEPVLPPPKANHTLRIRRTFDLTDAVEQQEDIKKMKELGLKQCKFCQMVFLATELRMHTSKMHKGQRIRNRCPKALKPATSQPSNNASPPKATSEPSPGKKGGLIFLQVFQKLQPNSGTATSNVPNGPIVIAGKAGPNVPASPVPVIDLTPKKREELHCALCKKLFRKRNSLKEHMGSHFGLKLYKCSTCSLSYATRAARNKHSKKHVSNWKVTCEFCGKGFLDKTTYSYHVRSTHTKEKPFTCELCDKSYFKKQDLDIHKRIIHGPPVKDTVECPVCRKRFRDSNLLSKHLERHNVPLEERQNCKCAQCPASFTSNSGLKHHMNSHTGEKPYQCTLCPCRLKTKRGLDVHMIYHSGLKSYVCEVCGNSFAQENTLKVHMRRHTGEKPAKCVNCKKSFSQTSSLNYHIKISGCKKK